MRALIAALLLTGCTSLPKPWPDNANGNLLSSTCQRAARQAKQGDQQAYQQCFFAAYSRARDHMLGGEDLESIDQTLRDLLATVGDDAFATALGAESAPVRSGVDYFLRSSALGAAYPETAALIKATPAYTFELEKASADALERD